MSSDAPMPAPDARPPTLDPVAARRWQRHVPEAAPWLHEEVARRMQERLDWIRLQPQAWAHWGPLAGGVQAHALLRARYPQAACHVVEASPAQAEAARRRLQPAWWRPQRWTQAPVRMGLPDPGAVQMLWANMALHTEAEPLNLLRQWHQALATDGFLMFSCLGPDTLRELRGLYQSLGWPVPGHAFTDMHDWGDMLVQTGFAEPVMDMERIVLTYERPERLLAELRGLGRNLHPQRFAALRGRRWRERLLQALADLAQPTQDGRLALTFEVIYGHALKPAPRVKLSAQSAVSLRDMREMLARDGRPGAVPGRKAG